MVAIMRKLGKLLITLAACGVLLRAQTPPPKISPAKAALIEEMIDETKPDAIIQQSLGQMKAAFSQSFESGFNSQVTQNHEDPAKYQKELRAFEDKMFGLISDRMSWARLKPKFIVMYDETFTQQELSDIVAFYKTPSGKSLLRKLPELMTKGSQVGQQEMMGVVPEIQQMTKDFMESMLKKKQDTAPK
jgi:hypothetical protein